MIDFEVLGQHNTDNPPAPGSARDTVGRQNEHQAAAATPNPVNENAYRAIDVKAAMPEEAVPRTVQLSVSNPYVLLLPRDMRRRRATIIPVTNDIALAENKEMASQAYAGLVNGTSVSTFGMTAYIPKGTAVVIEHRDLMWAVVSTTASTSPVTVIVERYAEDV
jgi:hypothetical protein